MNNKKRNIVKKNQNIVNIDPAFNDKLLRNGLKKRKKWSWYTPKSIKIVKKHSTSIYTFQNMQKCARVKQYHSHGENGRFSVVVFFSD